MFWVLEIQVRLSRLEQQWNEIGVKSYFVINKKSLKSFALICIKKLSSTILDVDNFSRKKSWLSIWPPD